MQPKKDSENKPANVKLYVYAKKNLQYTWKLKQEFHRERKVI